LWLHHTCWFSLKGTITETNRFVAKIRKLAHMALLLHFVQAVYVLFRDDSLMKLPHFIAIAGVVCAIFAIGIPHLSALGIWLGVSTILSIIYIIVAIVLSAKDGKLLC